TASAPPSANPKLKLDCLHMGPRARTGVYGREDCEVQKFAKVPGSNEVFKPPVNAAWDAQIAKQMRIHEPLPRGQEPRMDCPGANLGLGCSDEALSYSTKRKF
ncbi:MAG TPA: hypothetical protein VFN88_00955, partial [Caulobacteraceae bacterium]|nr:hypothetical protein [Caulobacteraceae bacterium]